MIARRSPCTPISAASSALRKKLILDFGLNPQPVGVPTQPIVTNQRIIVNLFTAKRLLQVLEMTIRRHEGAFGVLETDVQRRVHGK